MTVFSWLPAALPKLEVREKLQPVVHEPACAARNVGRIYAAKQSCLLRQLDENVRKIPS
jgi:hypothetical protein